MLIAGSKFSTDELYSDARTPPTGTAAQDPARHAQRLVTRAADGFWAGAHLQFSAQPTPTFAGGDGPHTGRPAPDG